MLGIGRTTQLIVKQIGKKNKENFLKNFNKATLTSKESVLLNIDMLGFCGTKSLSDQLFSMYSFYTNVGKPQKWIIFNDGTLKDNEKKMLQQFENVEVLGLQIPTEHIIYNYTQQYPTAKKIFLMENYVIERTTIFADSDILFFKTFKTYLNQFKKNNWYITDAGEGYFDKEYTTTANPLNLGFMILNYKPNWQIVNDYVKQKEKINNQTYWTDQTACDIMVKQDENFNALPYDIFPTGGTDSFKITHCFNYKTIALRHFVGPVRHKMWQLNWRRI